MALKTVFVCIKCAYSTPKWYGRCPSCGEGNTLVEEVYENKKNIKTLSKKSSENNIPVKINEIIPLENLRYKTGISEFDKILGGGIVKGSLVLIGGAPGIGKSTLLLQIVNNISDIKTIYISGEESKQQIKMRAIRLNLKLDNMFIMSETDIDEVIFQINNLKPNLVIIDSIQTMYKKDIVSIPGSISQVRECSNILLEFTKKSDVSVIIVSHINKDGGIAGPKVLEHIVDVVLYFEEFSK